MHRHDRHRANRTPARPSLTMLFAGAAFALPGSAAVASEEEGLQIEVGLVSVVQQVNAGGSDDGRRRSRFNARGDIVLKLPVGSLGDARGHAVGQLRFGQGNSVALRPTYTGAVNSTGADRTYVVVAQAYYQLDWPLDGGRFNNRPGNRLEFSVGKIDLFGLFDRNAVAGDEAGQFLNNAFVHNPLLDSGGDIAADAYGFAPGLRLGYFNEGDSLGWGVSFGVFASGAAARLNADPGRPLVIAQFELSPRQINSESRGNYRVYGWTNGRTSDLTGSEQRHGGIGVSVDQRLGRDWNLFGRYGRRSAGDGAFDSALTLGFEHGGRAWGRRHDALGVAAGWLKTGSAWRSATADGSLTGFAVNGAEQITELYYRIKLNEHIELTPDFQLIRRAGGDANAATVRLLGLRASLGF